jgi:hypothetical protein
MRPTHYTLTFRYASRIIISMFTAFKAAEKIICRYIIKYNISASYKTSAFHVSGHIITSAGSGVTSVDEDLYRLSIDLRLSQYYIVRYYCFIIQRDGGRAYTAIY